MIEVHPTHSIGSASRGGKGIAAARSAAEFLCLAAMPAFATMALLTGLGGRSMDGLCAFGHGAPLNGMAIMYLLMSAFHSPPWLNLVCGSRASLNARQANSQTIRAGCKAIR